MTGQQDIDLITDDPRVRVFEGTAPCFGASRHGCLLPAAWSFDGKDGCTPHIATLVRKAGR